MAGLEIECVKMCKLALSSGPFHSDGDVLYLRYLLWIPLATSLDVQLVQLIKKTTCDHWLPNFRAVLESG